MCSLYSTCPFAHTQMPTTACTTTHAKERNRSIDVARETEKEHRRQIFFEKYRKCCTGTSIYSLYWFDVGWYVSFHTYRQSSCERKRESRVDCDIESCHVWGGGEFFFWMSHVSFIYKGIMSRKNDSYLIQMIHALYKWFMPHMRMLALTKPSFSVRFACSTSCRCIGEIRCVRLSLSLSLCTCVCICMYSICVYIYVYVCACVCVCVCVFVCVYIGEIRCQIDLQGLEICGQMSWSLFQKQTEWDDCCFQEECLYLFINSKEH